MHMPKISLSFAALFILLGVLGYLLTGMQSVTALIPAFLGLLLALLGWLGLARPALRKHVMHGAALLALIGIGGTFRGLLQAVSLAGGASVERPEAVIAQALMCVLSLLFLTLCIKSFVDARLLRKGQAPVT